MAFGAASLAYFLPKTASNLNAYLSSLERTYAPGVASQRAELSESLHKSLVGAKRSYDDARTSAADGMRSARRQLEESTGLKVGDLEASANSTVAVAKTHVEGTVARIQEEAQELGSGLKRQAEEVQKERGEPPKRLV